jgi:hypothetical protein
MSNSTATPDTSIAQETCKQMGGTRRLMAMVGGKNFLSDGAAFSFRFTGQNKIKANYLKVTLNSLDTYDMEFGRVHGDSYKIMATLNNVYGDQLKAIFEEKTGLYLSL